MRFRAPQILIAILALAGSGAGKLPQAVGHASTVLLAREFSPQQPSGQSSVSHTVWDGIYTPEQASRGQSVYFDQCAQCHSATLTGGDLGPPLLGGEFLSAWNGKAAGDLFERIRLSMPKDSPGKLTQQQTVDLVAYLFQENAFPAGQEALEADLAALTLIRIEPRKAR